MTKKVIYFDCPTGASGDMLLAALIDCGADLAAIKQHLQRLNLAGWQMTTQQVAKSGLMAHKIDFICPAEDCHRHLSDILLLIEQAALPAAAAELAVRAFTLLAEAEAKAHGCSIEQVHFHEVGAADAILDICGVALAYHLLDISQVYCSDLPLSSGFVDCAHGRLPVPAPATLNLLQGLTLFDSGLVGELITPTGAALLRAMQVRQQRPSLQLTAVGLGAGTRELPQPNVLRALYGELKPEATGQFVEVITCNLDDSNGELLSHVLPLFMAAGALDACYTPLVMKKGRPAWQLQIICPPDLTDDLAGLVLQETSGIGLRISRERRIIAERISKTIETTYGPVRVKYSGNNAAPEYEDLAEMARKHQIPYKKLLQEISSQIHQPEE